MSVYLNVRTMHVCWQQAMFHSWIKPGQRPRGLQVNVVYFKQLFLPSHSISNTHIHSHAFCYEDESQHERKPQDVVYTFDYFCMCFLKSACSLSRCFWMFFILLFYILLVSVMLSPFSLVTSLSFCFFLFSSYFHLYFCLVSLLYFKSSTY